MLVSEMRGCSDASRWVVPQKLNFIAFVPVKNWRQGLFLFLRREKKYD